MPKISEPLNEEQKAYILAYYRNTPLYLVAEDINSNLYRIKEYLMSVPNLNQEYTLKELVFLKKNYPKTSAFAQKVFNIHKPTTETTQKKNPRAGRPKGNSPNSYSIRLAHVQSKGYYSIADAIIGIGKNELNRQFKQLQN